MTKSNTPLEITNHIKDNAAALFEVRRTSRRMKLTMRHCGLLSVHFPAHLANWREMSRMHIGMPACLSRSSKRPF